MHLQYGLYRFFLGPTIENKYHKIVAQGIPHVTGFFHKMELSTITGELRSIDSSYKDEVLPKHIGGSCAQLLLGIKDPSIYPSMLFQ